MLKMLFVIIDIGRHLSAPLPPLFGKEKRKKITAKGVHLLAAGKGVECAFYDAKLTP
jgi:hypothetical protein